MTEVHQLHDGPPGRISRPPGKTSETSVPVDVESMGMARQ